MNSYQEQAQKREQRINAMRVSDALYSAINGQFAGVELPTVQNLRQYVTGKAYDDLEKAGEIED